MATYAIGDIQGCYEPFLQLLERVRFDPGKDRLWLVGDLVNRGPSSLEVLRWVVSHRECVQSVLGNHDVYALARHFDATARTEDDTLDAFMAAPDREALVSWLLECPLLFEADGRVMVHAGLLPSWDLPTARAEARAAQGMLRGAPRAFLGAYFHRKRAPWSLSLGGVERAVAATAVMTRIRFVDVDGDMVSGSGPPERPPVAHAIPWFRAPRKAAGTPIIFGHWASLGLWLEGDVMALDSGCVWKGALSAVRLEDRALFSVPCGRDD